MDKTFRTFSDICAGSPDNGVIVRGSYEFRYAAAALLVACSKVDFDEDPAEAKVIVEIIQSTFDLTAATLESLLLMAEDASEEYNLVDITKLVNQYYSDGDKLILLEYLWRVVYADGRVDKFEELFIHRIAAMIQMTGEDVNRAKENVSSK